nr:SAV_2336 N-terminal domain-related protein [Streptomyces sp. SID5468]
MRAAGLDADAEGLADALWLARRIAPPPEPEAAPDRTDPATLAPPEDAGTPPSAPAGAPPPDGRPAAGAGRIALRPLRPDEAAPAEETLVRIPVATAFPGLLPLERALRPLQRYRPRVPPRRGPLDEAATAETSARSGHIVPVFTEARRREAMLLLVMDDSPSMVVWHQMLEELRVVFAQVGAFRDVAVHYLRARSDGGAGVAAGPGGADPLAPADRLRDPTGRTVTLLLSDCSGALWRRGAGQRLLHRFARTGPVAVLQPLPQRMWSRTLLPTESGVLRGADGPGGRLDFLPRRRSTRPRPPGALAVPVLAPTAVALGAWARAVSGTARASLDAAAAWVHADHTGAEEPPRAPRTAEQLVGDFQAVASPAAQHLAVYLSAAPLAYPVMQLVQRAMVPQTGPTEMAEVLLSGLLVRHEGRRADDGTDPAYADGGPWYEFADGVQDVLLRRLGLGEASLVLKHCSLYVERVFGRRARNFPAQVVGYLSGEPGPAEPGRATTTPVPRQFAEVSQKVLRRFQPGGVATDARPRAASATATSTGGPGVVIAHQGRVVEEAAERLRRFQAHGTIRDLWEAIRLLRSAPYDDRRPAHGVPLRTLLATCLLDLWRARGGDEVLAEAEETARSATALADRSRVPADTAAQAQLVLGQVLREVASRPETAALTDRTPGQALGEAAEALEHAYRLLRHEPRALLDIQLRIVEVARERYEITGDRDLLHDAQLRLDAVLESWPTGEPVPADALVARGGLLRELADDAVRRLAPQEARSLALRAVADFEVIDRAAGAATGPSAQRCRVLMELAAARAVAAGDPGDAHALADLDRALAAAEGLPELKLEVLRRLGAAHFARYGHTAETAELALADAAFARALPLVPVDDPARAGLLVERGRVLVEWGARGGGLEVATDAVRVLREALAQTPESHRLLPERRLLFGRALRERRAAGGAPTDLHEAEWILHRAARGAADAEDPATAARAWLDHGDVLLRLAAGRGAQEKLDQAAESFLRSAEHAVRAGEPLLAAQAHHRRGTVLERTAGAARALESYRAAWEQWQRSGAAGDPQARSTLERMRALEGTA